MEGDALVFAALVVGFAVVSGRLVRWNVTAAIAFAAAGWSAGLLTDQALPTEPTKLLAEATLTLLLFSDASHARPREIGGDRGLVARLLLLGLPLTIVLGALVGSWFFGGLEWPFILLLAAALAPTDAGLGAATVLNPVVPVRVRRVLNVESGLNDGLATPVVLFAIAAAAEGAEADTGGWAAVGGALAGIALGVAVGVAVGGIGGAALAASRRRGWSEAPARGIATFVLPLAAYAGAVTLDGNGFIAAFVAGTTYAAAHGVDEESALLLSESVAELLGFAVWFAFGVAASSAVRGFGWAELGFALLSLTLLRMLPVWLCLLGSGLRLRTVAFVGWFGPRGLASVVFVLLAVEDLPRTAALERVTTVVALTVLLSVVLHGVTADPLAKRYGAWVRREEPTVETVESVEPRRRSTRLGRSARHHPVR